MLGTIIEQAVPEPALLTTAPPSVEVVVRERGLRLVVHLINHAPGKSLAQNSAFVEKVPLTEPFTLTLAVGAEPLTVRLLPEDKEPEWSFAEGTLTVYVPPFHIHTALVVEAAPAEPAPTIAQSSTEAPVVDAPSAEPLPANAGIDAVSVPVPIGEAEPPSAIASSDAIPPDPRPESH
jgi:hypothetical protein